MIAVSGGHGFGTFAMRVNQVPSSGSIRRESALLGAVDSCSAPATAGSRGPGPGGLSGAMASG